MRKGFRLNPQLPAGAYNTYALSAPLATHFRNGHCSEVDCDPHLNGWRTFVDETAELGQRQAFYIRKQSGRSFTEHRDEDGLTCFHFEAGQRCFREHRVRIDKPEHFQLWRGDWRVQPRRDDIRVFNRSVDWIDSMQTHQDKLKTILERG